LALNAFVLCQFYHVIRHKISVSIILLASSHRFTEALLGCLNCFGVFELVFEIAGCVSVVLPVRVLADRRSLAYSLNELPWSVLPHLGALKNQMVLGLLAEALPKPILLQKRLQNQF
jgi:hypothetical protein